jgi:uncharacterized protein (TIGR02246 family)
MPAREPQDVHRRFVESFNAGDLDALMALYEPSAAMIPEPGKLVSGADAIRSVLTQFLALKGTIALNTRTVAQAGELALLHGEWTLRGTGSDGRASRAHLGGGPAPGGWDLALRDRQPVQRRLTLAGPAHVAPVAPDAGTAPGSRWPRLWPRG